MLAAGAAAARSTGHVASGAAQAARGSQRAGRRRPADIRTRGAAPPSRRAFRDRGCLAGRSWSPPPSPPTSASGRSCPKDRRSRPQRRADAVDELRTLQAEYEAWRDQLPEALADSRTAELLGGVLCDLDLDGPRRRPARGASAPIKDRDQGDASRAGSHTEDDTDTEVTVHYAR